MMPSGDPKRADVVLDADPVEDRSVAARRAIHDILALLSSAEYVDRPQALLDAVRAVAENAIGDERSIIYLDEAPSAEDLRAESEEVAAILGRTDLDSIAGIKELGSYVARLSRLVRHLVDRSTSSRP